MNKPGEFERWTHFTHDEMNKFLDTFYGYYHKVMESLMPVLGIKNERDVRFHKKTLMELIERIEKRRVYFKIYYSENSPDANCDMGEFNEAALYCYWITKLKPFYWSGRRGLNEAIAAVWFIHALDSYVNKRNAKSGSTTARTLEVPKRIVNVLTYDLRFREISKEALMILAETLVEYTPS